MCTALMKANVYATGARPPKFEFVRCFARVRVRRVVRLLYRAHKSINPEFYNCVVSPDAMMVNKMQLPFLSEPFKSLKVGPSNMIPPVQKYVPPNGKCKPEHVRRETCVGVRR